MFNDKVFEKIKNTNQIEKLNSFYCELEPTGLYMGYSYEAASFIIPKNFVIVDLGCYMGAQGFLFEDFKKYIGIDIFEKYFNDSPKRFETSNSEHFCMSIQEFLNSEDFKNLDLNNTYAIMNAVPIKEEMKEIFDAFPNIIISYPGTQSIAKGIFEKEMLYFENLLYQNRCPYTQKYLNDNPDIKKEFEEKQKVATTEVNNYINKNKDLER